VTRRSIIEYAQALRDRYYQASKEGKGVMLDEFVKVTGLHRKAAIRLLRRVNNPNATKPRGRPRLYGLEAVKGLQAIWEASDRLCSRRLHPFIPEMIRVLREHGEQHLDAITERQLNQMSPSTIDRLLRSCRKQGGRKSISTTRAGICLKAPFR
jgi:hypothetical protein